MFLKIVVYIQLAIELQIYWNLAVVNLNKLTLWNFTVNDPEDMNQIFIDRY